jgi:hypothetical protein
VQNFPFGAVTTFFVPAVMLIIPNGSQQYHKTPGGFEQMLLPSRHLELMFILVLAGVLHTGTGYAFSYAFCHSRDQ